MKPEAITTCLALLMSCQLLLANPLPVNAAQLSVVIQPLGSVDKKLVDAVKSEIELEYNAKVSVLKQVPLPAMAFFPQRSRYRAEKLLNFLRETDKVADKIIGVTTVDISTTKGKYPDWGILGLGNIGGRACVVSTFRMQSKKVSAKVFGHRLAKVVAHELGHTFGLKHCPSKGCTMQDAKGTVRTIDGETGFCESCRKFLDPVLQKSATDQKTN